MGGETHDERLARAYLVVADAAAVHREHPDTVLLTLIQAATHLLAVLIHGLRYFVLRLQPCPVDAGEPLVRAVELRLHVAIKKPVILLSQPVAQCLRLSQEPVLITLSDFLNQRVSFLRCLRVLVLGIAALALLNLAAHLVAAILHHLWAAVLQGMLQQIHTVERLAGLAAHGILRIDFLVATVTGTGILIQVTVILHRHFHLAAPLVALHREELRGKVLVDFAVHPSLTEVEVQIIEWDRLRHRLLQGIQGATDISLRPVAPFRHVCRPVRFLCLRSAEVRVLLQDSINLLNHIPADKASLDLPLLAQGIIVYLPVQLVADFFLALARQRSHIAHIGLAIVIERLCQCLVSVRHAVHLVRRECHRPVENVCLAPLSVLQYLQRQQFLQVQLLRGLHVFGFVQRAELLPEAIIRPVQPLAGIHILLHLRSLAVVKLLIVVVDGQHVELSLVYLLPLSALFLLLALGLRLAVGLALLLCAIPAVSVLGGFAAEVSLELLRQVLAQHLAQLLCNPLHAVAVLIYKRPLSIGIRINRPRRSNHPLRPHVEVHIRWASSVLILRQ